MGKPNQYNYSLEGWLAPNGRYTPCAFDSNGTAQDHTTVARSIIAEVCPDEYNRQYFMAQEYLLNHGYIRLDIHSIGKCGVGWDGLTEWQVWALHEIYNLKPKRRFFPYKLLRLLLVANGVDYLRQADDNSILSKPYIVVERQLDE